MLTNCSARQNTTQPTRTDTQLANSPSLPLTPSPSHEWDGKRRRDGTGTIKPGRKAEKWCKGRCNNRYVRCIPIIPESTCRAQSSSALVPFETPQTTRHRNTRYPFCENGYQIRAQGGALQIMLASLLRVSGRYVARSVSVSAARRRAVEIQSEEDFQRNVIQSDIPVIVDFHAT